MSKVVRLNAAERTAEEIHTTPSPSRTERAVTATCNTGKRWLMEMATGLITILLPVLNIIGKLSILITLILVPVEVSRHGHEIIALLVVAATAISCMALATWCERFLHNHAYGQM